MTVALLAAGCSGGETPAAPPAAATPDGLASPPAAQAPADDQSATAEAPLLEVASPYDVLPANVRAVMGERFTGDLDEMVKRRIIRAGVTFNRTH